MVISFTLTIIAFFLSLAYLWKRNHTKPPSRSPSPSPSSSAPSLTPPPPTDPNLSQLGVEGSKELKKGMLLKKASNPLMGFQVRTFEVRDQMLSYKSKGCQRVYSLRHATVTLQEYQQQKRKLRICTTSRTLHLLAEDEKTALVWFEVLSASIGASASFSRASPVMSFAHTDKLKPNSRAFFAVDLDAEQRAAVDDIKKTLQERGLLAGYDLDNPIALCELDLELCRFLRARKWDKEKAINLYTNMLEWRSKNNVDAILESPDPIEAAFACCCPHSHHGHDREGNPLYIEKTGMIRVPMMLQYMEEKDIVARHVRYMEYIVRRTQYRSAAEGRNIEKQVVIMDLSHLSLKPDLVGMRAFKACAQIDADYYPERLCRFFFVNTPVFFQTMWKAIAPFIDPTTRKKFVFLGYDYAAGLQTFIDPSQLPREYGGTCECGSHGFADKTPLCISQKTVQCPPPPGFHVDPWPYLANLSTKNSKTNNTS